MAFYIPNIYLFIYFTVYLLRPSVIQIMQHGVKWKRMWKKAVAT
jgi:hypothetical protein